MSQILCFGELLLRMSPQLNGAWISQQMMPVYIGGAELNVASALAKWMVPVSYCTALPDHYLSREIISALNQKGIDTKNVVLFGNRIGSYYLPQGTDLQHAGVIYDRAYSSFWDLKPGQLDWDLILKDVTWFHFSAISPALHEQAATVCREGVEAASAKGITLSIDLNYRSRLWQYGKLPHDVMPDLVAYCDVVMGNIWSADTLLGIKADTTIHDKKSKAAYLDHAKRTAEKIMSQYPKTKMVANTFRFANGNGMRYYATLDDHNGQSVSEEYVTPTIVDQVGSGDTFMAGLVYGNYHQQKPQQIIDFAAAAAFNKLFIKGDATTASVEEIMKGHLKYA